MSISVKLVSALSDYALPACSLPPLHLRAQKLTRIHLGTYFIRTRQPHMMSPETPRAGRLCTPISSSIQAGPYNPAGAGGEELLVENASTDYTTSMLPRYEMFASFHEG
jgi:hypothetical protein